MDKIKLILTDMDGTLLHNDKSLPKGFFELVDDLTSRGILFGIASGRSYSSLSDTFEVIKDKLIFICDNGTAVYHHDECIYNDEMSFQDLHLIHSLIKGKKDSYMIFCGLKGAYVFANDDNKFHENTKMYYHNITLIDELEDIDDVIIKIAIYDADSAKDNLLPLFKNLKKELVAVNSSINWVDISNAGISKGSALGLVQKKFNISQKETMVFGDYINDLELLESAYYSYAMANAVPEIKSVSNFVAPSNEEDGVLQILREYFY